MGLGIGALAGYAKQHIKEKGERKEGREDKPRVEMLEEEEGEGAEGGGWRRKKRKKKEQ